MLAIEDYIEDKSVGRRRANKLRRLGERNPEKFVSEGRLTERFKPYVLPFIKEGNKGRI